MIWALLAILHIIGAAFDDMAGKVFHFQESTTVDILKKAYYPVESHVVVTEDGYILTMHRIPHGKNSTDATKGPVLLMHGLLSSSADWVVTGEKSLALVLANAGYDVWLGNNRGNTYSRQHTQLDALLNHEAFFEFSYHELGKFDLPAMIDYILMTTQAEKLPYVGFSQGVAEFFAMISERPEYNEKISAMIAWAPRTHADRIQSTLTNLVAKYRILDKLASIVGWYEMFAHHKVGNSIRAICWMADWFCNRVFLFLGSSWDRMPNKVLKSKILENFPAGMSLQQAVHFVQGARSGVFRPFDYGTENNMQIYHKPLPDPYNLSAVTVPVILYYGGSDKFVNNEILINDVVKELKNVTSVLVPYDNFCHLDFIWSTDVDWLIDATLSDLDRYNENTPSTELPSDSSGESATSFPTE